jgi:RNA polymerase sigma-70 factor, ECF subfamily
VTTTGRLISFRRFGVDADSMSDEAVLAATATGDLAALDVLFDRFHVAVYQFLGRLASADELARDDLVQATFLEARNGAKRFRGGSSVKTWILGIAANVTRHHLRGERRRREKHARYAEALQAVPEQPDQQLERRELAREIEDTLAGLPHDLRVAFILCDLEEIPGVEVARGIGVPPGTLWRRLHDARKAVRAAVEKATR